MAAFLIWYSVHLKQLNKEKLIWITYPIYKMISSWTQNIRNVSQNYDS